MSETEQGATVVELLLREPEIVAWLDDYRPPARGDDEPDDDREPPWAA
ncbi:MAG: hypothetical protein ACRDLK_02590 [Gaiellaceae bacterium]